MECGGVPYRRDSQKACHTPLSELIERGHNLGKNLLDGEGLASLCDGDLVVEVKDIDPFHLQPPQTVFQRFGDTVTDAAELGTWYSHLGAHECAGGPQPVKYVTEIPFGLAVSILHRGVEVVYALLQGPSDGSLLVARITAHHEASDSAAAEAENREL